MELVDKNPGVATLSNEDTVALIQAGERERMTALWEQNLGLVKKKAHYIMSTMEINCGVEFNDLVNAGYLALAAAVETYKPGSAKFTTWFGYYLQTVFAESAGYRTQKGKKDPMKSAFSLDNSVSDADGQLSDVVPDPNGQLPLQEIEEQEFQKQLQKAVEEALAAIPPKCSEVLRCRYFEGKTLREVAEAKGMGHENIRMRELQGLNELRKPEVACHLRPFYTFDFYHGAGLNSFRHTGMSIQERYLILTEDREYMERLKREQENNEAEQAHQKANNDLVNEILSKQSSNEMSTRQLTIETGICQATLKRRLADPDGLTLCELWKLIRILRLDPAVVHSALGYTR